jgi:hypothetical protein
VGKTALVRGLIAALPEFHWTAVKVTTHEHGHTEPIWEETAPGQSTDTGRYLAAGAARALLITAQPDQLPRIVDEFFLGLPPQPNVIFESNRVLRHLQPDLCLAVEEDLNGRLVSTEPKGSYKLVDRKKDATITLAQRDALVEGIKPVFQLAALTRISPEMIVWLRKKLSER